MYKVNFSQPVKSYIDDNLSNYYVAGVRAVLKITANTLDGFPDDPDSCFYLSETDRVYWLVERHFVSYERGTNELYVTEVKPLE